MWKKVSILIVLLMIMMLTACGLSDEEQKETVDIVTDYLKNKEYTCSYETGTSSGNWIQEYEGHITFNEDCSEVFIYMRFRTRNNYNWSDWNIRSCTCDDVVFKATNKNTVKMTLSYSYYSDGTNKYYDEQDTLTITNFRDGGFTHINGPLSIITNNDLEFNYVMGSGV